MTLNALISDNVQNTLGLILNRRQALCDILLRNGQSAELLLKVHVDNLAMPLDLCRVMLLNIFN